MPTARPSTKSRRGGSATSATRASSSPRSAATKAERAAASPPGAPGFAVGPLRAALLAWYDRSARDLPWRRRRDPYATLVSEVMLQQTTVAVVIPYFERFLAAFPTLDALAAAELDAVLRHWSGLGYYRRARHLHAAARAVVRDHGGRLPADLAALRALPGIGSYTAAAVASIAYGVAAPVVDGNVERVLARLATWEGSPKHQPVRGQIAQLAAALLDPARPGDSNQALMELGATVCAPRAPLCSACPWQDRCRAHARGEERRFPTAAARPTTVLLARAALWLEDPQGRVLLVRVPEGEINAGLWELPAVRLPVAESCSKLPTWNSGWRDLARTRWQQRFGASVHIEDGPPRARIRHSITHHRITTFLLGARGELRIEGGGRGVAAEDAARDAAEHAAAHGTWRWVEVAALAAEGLTGEARKLVRAAGSTNARANAPTISAADAAPSAPDPGTAPPPRRSAAGARGRSRR